MNIAFPAFVLLLAGLPGILFRRTDALARNEETEAPSFTEEVFAGSIAALVAHLLWLTGAFVLSPVTHLKPDFRSLLVLLGGKDVGDASLQKEALSAVADHPIAIAIYFSTVCVAAATVGLLWRFSARTFLSVCLGGRERTELAVAELGNENQTLSKRRRIIAQMYAALEPTVPEDEQRLKEWAGWLDAEPELPDGATAGFRYVAAVVEMGDVPYLFRGELVETFWTKERSPERFELRNVKRRRLSDDGANETFYPIRGQRFFLWRSELKTLNIEDLYVSEIVEVTDEDPPPPPPPTAEADARLATISAINRMIAELQIDVAAGI